MRSNNLQTRPPRETEGFRRPPHSHPSTYQLFHYDPQCLFPTTTPPIPYTRDNETSTAQITGQGEVYLGRIATTQPTATNQSRDQLVSREKKCGLVFGLPLPRIRVSWVRVEPSE